MSNGEGSKLKQWIFHKKFDKIKEILADFQKWKDACVFVI